MKKTRSDSLKLLALAWDLGYMIAVPIVLFAMAGVWLDKQWGTAPWLLFFWIFLAIIVTSFWIRSKLDNLIKKAVR